MAGIFSFFSRDAAQVADPLAQQAADIKALKQEAIARAALDAKAERRMPTLTDYFIACEELGEQRRDEFAMRGMHWGVRVYADISGLALDGYLIRKDDVAPPAEARAAASQHAKAIAAHQNRQATTLDYLYAMREELEKFNSTKKAS